MLRERESEGKETEMIECKSDQAFDNQHVSSAPKISRSNTEANDTIKVILAENSVQFVPNNKTEDFITNLMSLLSMNYYFYLL